MYSNQMATAPFLRGSVLVAMGLAAWMGYHQGHHQSHDTKSPAVTARPRILASPDRSGNRSRVSSTADIVRDILTPPPGSSTDLLPSWDRISSFSEDQVKEAFAKYYKPETRFVVYVEPAAAGSAEPTPAAPSPEGGQPKAEPAGGR